MNTEHGYRPGDGVGRSGCAPDSPHMLLWGWPEVLAAVGIPRRTLEREMAARRFPRPSLRVGKRPYWKPADVIRWAEGGEG